MFKFAEIENDIVTNVIIANSLEDLPNTRTFIAVTNLTGEALLNSTYDSSNNIFIIPSPYPSWLFNYSTKQWEAPIPKPSDFGEILYEWNESNTSWIISNVTDSTYANSMNFLVQELNIDDATSNISNLTIDTNVTSNTIEIPVSAPSLNLSFMIETHPGINENTEITHENGMIIMMNLTPPTQ
jgi:hypothetical protein